MPRISLFLGRYLWRGCRRPLTSAVVFFALGTVLNGRPLGLPPLGPVQFAQETVLVRGWLAPGPSPSCAHPRGTSSYREIVRPQTVWHPSFRPNWCRARGEPGTAAVGFTRLDRAGLSLSREFRWAGRWPGSRGWIALRSAAFERTGAQGLSGWSATGCDSVECSGDAYASAQIAGQSLFVIP